MSDTSYSSGDVSVYSGDQTANADTSGATSDAATGSRGASETQSPSYDVASGTFSGSTTDYNSTWRDALGIGVETGVINPGNPPMNLGGYVSPSIDWGSSTYNIKNPAYPTDIGLIDYTNVPGTNVQAIAAMIRARESTAIAAKLGVDPYSLPPDANYNYARKDALHSEASGAYQFQPATWQEYTQQSGIGVEYPEAYMAPAYVQDAVAAYAIIHGPGVNSSALWKASAHPTPYPDVAFNVAPYATPTTPTTPTAFPITKRVATGGTIHIPLIGDIPNPLAKVSVPNPATVKTDITNAVIKAALTQPSPVAVSGSGAATGTSGDTSGFDTTGLFTLVSAGSAKANQPKTSAGNLIDPSGQYIIPPIPSLGFPGVKRSTGNLATDLTNDAGLSIDWQAYLPLAFVGLLAILFLTVGVKSLLSE